MKWHTTVDQGVATITRAGDVIFVTAYMPNRVYAFLAHCHDGCRPLWQTKIASSNYATLSAPVAVDNILLINEVGVGVRTFHTAS